MFGSPVVAIVTLTLAFAFIYAGIKNQNIVDVLTGKTQQGIQPGIIGGALGAPGLAQNLTGTPPAQPTAAKLA